MYIYFVAGKHQVNAGPMAYARAFLEEGNAKKYPDNQVRLLKVIFRYLIFGDLYIFFFFLRCLFLDLRYGSTCNQHITSGMGVSALTADKLLLSASPCRQFAEACGQALDVNEKLIKEDQLEYQEEMKAHYRDMLSELSDVMNEQVSKPSRLAF